MTVPTFPAGASDALPAVPSPAPPAVRKRYVSTAQGSLHLQEAGRHGNQALVIVTPTSFSSPLLGPALQLLAERGWHAVALDLMGYGRSDKRRDHWTVADFADNVLDALQAAGVEPFGMAFGHFSCWTGIEIASRRPPPLPGLRGLVLDGSPRFGPEQREGLLAAGPPAATPWSEDGAHAQAYWAKVWRILHQLDPQRGLDPVPSPRFRDAVMCLLEASVYEPNTAMAAAHFAIEERLPLIDLPTLFMCSDTDWNLPHHEPLVAAVRGARSLRLAGVNPLHDLHQDRMAEYGQHLHDFFAALR